MTIPHNPTRRHLLAIAARVAGVTAGLAVTPAHAGFLEDLFSWISGKKGRGKGKGGGKGSGGSNGARCFVRGTRILTVNGEVAIEELRSGDLVKTLSGPPVPVKWVARQMIDETSIGPASRFEVDSARPIRIERFALDDTMPKRDLYVTTSHCLYFDGYLIPALELINGASITSVSDRECEAIEYYHILLDTHEVIFAEGTPSETLLLTSPEELKGFVNGHEYLEAFGEPDGSMMPCAPVLRYRGVAHVIALLRRACYPVDVRDPVQIVYDRIAARCRRLAA